MLSDISTEAKFQDRENRLAILQIRFRFRFRFPASKKKVFLPTSVDARPFLSLLMDKPNLIDIVYDVSTCFSPFHFGDRVLIYRKRKNLLSSFFSWHRKPSRFRSLTVLTTPLKNSQVSYAPPLCIPLINLITS